MSEATADAGTGAGEGVEKGASRRPVRMEASWKARLAPEFDTPHMKALGDFLRREKAAGKIIFPPGADIFRAFELTPFDAVKVVILGQDPYHGAGQAHGLSFSVAHGVRPPPSLENIYKELAGDLGIAHPGHGNLARWAEQGVLLLNSCLTVEQGMPGSHQERGWERFTDAALRVLEGERRHLVFILWGRKARDRGAFIDRTRHLVLESTHPSPFSANHGFLGSRPFSRANAYLESSGQSPIDWNPS